MKPLFVKGPSVGARLLLLSLLAFAFILAGQRYQWFKSLESSLSVISAPFYWVTDMPDRLELWVDENLVSRKTLRRDNRRLKAESLLLKAQVQKLASLEAENVRLRALLNSSALLDDTVLVAELIGVSSSPLHHEIIINKGQTDQLFVGQPVIDALGLMGQVIEVGPKQSRVMMITDASHAIPVQVNRNGVRSIAEGVGLLHELTLRHVSATTDIRVGDLLVSSGLGGRFPFGYPVATVTEVSIDPGQPFATVRAKPNAQLDRSRYVLLVFTRQGEQG
ncbi:rod shape-determining protein MreC [Dasania sp. GY-MA-18]|uniref:Cell shape-determining protein MreC n=1 Tax=Dasania phycosphaerae TaxID=2950436 RepID=A0A9J6RH72_9GAMM|nr:MULTISPECIES: rod shape-determining protein MreC [Dasania]MCR8921586.1 rod shape-determining protein MreC [Dasania sp. GY-MA-18]MCZ0864014.1 rod shape-determining protein MreC [Dasania phycosphaerae]MCZ0867742.1 rod shape-determining protein MreC [Dasania phycosphaerae]